MQSQNTTNSLTSPHSRLNHLKHLDDREYDINCHLISSIEETQCKFWLGIYKKGTLEPSELFKSKGFDQILKTASKKGVSSKEPLLFSDCSDGETQYLLLVPELETSNSISSWLEQISKSITSISPKNIGIHFGVELMDKHALFQAIFAFLSDSLNLKKSMQLNQIFILTAGHDYKDVLNVIYKIKKELQGQDLAIKIFH